MNYQELKNIIHTIKTEEEKEYGFCLDIEAYNLKEYYHSKTLKENLKLSKTPKEYLENIFLPLQVLGEYHTKDQKIMIFINFWNGNHTIEKVLTTTYHEIFHRIDDETFKNNPTNYIDFLYNTETLSINHSNKFYNEHYNEYISELHADLYGITKTLNFLKTNNLLTPSIEYHLNNIQTFYEHKLQCYSPEIFLNQVQESYQENQPAFLSPFYHHDNSLKLPNELTLLPIDQRIIDSIITSRSYLKSLDLEHLTESDRTCITYRLKEEIQKEEENQTSTNHLLQHYLKNTNQLLSENIPITTKLHHLIENLTLINNLLEFKLHQNQNKFNYYKTIIPIQKQLIMKK